MPKAGGGGSGDRRHHPQAAGEAAGGRGQPAVSAEDESDAGARRLHQGQLAFSGPGEVHEHPQDLPQRTATHRIHLNNIWLIT